MIVCIAEKPSVGRDIAKVLGAAEKHEGYYEGNGYQVTWALGHLLCLKEPHDYLDSWKKWSLDVLPMVPPRFGIKLIDDAGTKKQFNIVKQLVANAREVINCGDAGQEGELIQRWILQYAKVKCPVKRLWISSLTEEAIRDGFRHLTDQSRYDNLYMAGLSRACGDWLLGINATRLYTLKYGRERQVLSIGRVQTPTLALIVQRDKEISEFRPEPYWVLQTKYRDVLFTAVQGKFTDRKEGERVLSSIAGRPFVITDVSKKQGSEPPRQLYDLTALQIDCNKKYSLSAETTLNTIQSLYEKRLTTYPRVDTRYLSDDIYPQCAAILDNVIRQSAGGIGGRVGETLQHPLPKSKRVFDTSKVTDHHAIIPTGIKPSGLNQTEERVYDLIVRSFVSAFMPDCRYSTTTVTGKAGETAFKVTGKEILAPGWRILYQDYREDEEDAADQDREKEEKVLPSFVRNESGPHQPVLQSKMTTPPKPYTEASLLQAMETAGRFVEDEELKAAMKENGIGRPSSRASIIETLFKRNYIKRNRKNISATPIGRQLIGLIQYELLKSCELTGIWEKKLRDMERGKYDPRRFIEELKGQLLAIVSSVKADNSQRFVDSFPQTDSKGEAHGKRTAGTKPSSSRRAKKAASPGKMKVTHGQACPLCRQGQVIKGKYSYFCSRHNEGCKFKSPL